jgi:antitoxin component of MazEF toxin-antitoxin module
MSTILRADATGAVTLPADLCRAAGVSPGAEIVAEIQSGQIVIKQSSFPFWEQIASLTKDAPPEELDKAPVDGAAQIDHYVYGLPKRK